MAVADKLILDRLTIREAQLYQQADAIDVKASILLVAVIFLAGQTIGLLHDAHVGFTHYEQIVAGIFEVIATGVLAWLLRIQNGYIQEPAEDYPGWRDAIVTEGKSLPEDQLENRMISEIVPDLAKHCAAALQVNTRKIKLMRVAFWLVILILGMNLVPPALHVLGFTSS
jgi:hypothetical protein